MLCAQANRETSVSTTRCLRLPPCEDLDYFYAVKTFIVSLKWIFCFKSFCVLSLRGLVSDFGIVIAMTSMLLLDVFLHDTVTTQKITIGDPTKRGFLPTRFTERGWFINPGGMAKAMETGWIFAAIIPATFVGILLFMETELTGVLLNKKEHKLTKGAGFTLDLCIMGLLSFVCSLMGLPWMCAATVRSVSHLNALSIWSTSHAPGVKPRLIEVKEQRVTNIAIHVLTGQLVFDVLLISCYSINILSSRYVLRIKRFIN